MEEQNNKSELVIEKDEIITLDARGKKIKIYKSTLALSGSAYFKGIIGESGFKTSPQNDGSYFIDCDKKIFENMISYIETGYIRDTDINPKYISKIFRKFDIPSNTEKSKDKEKIKRDLLYTKLMNDIQSLINKQTKDSFTVYLEFFRGSENQSVVKESIVCVLAHGSMFIDLARAHESKFLREELFKNLKKENYFIDIIPLPMRGSTYARSFKFVGRKLPDVEPASSACNTILGNSPGLYNY